jgi:cardiolipin synthase
MASPERKQIWSIPNLISLFRLLLIPLMVGFYFKAKTIAALCVFALSALSDIVDGQIARRFHMVTDLGKMLDPLADKLTQGAALVCVAQRHPKLFFLLGFMAMKELVQASIGARSMKKTGQAFSSKWFGKLCTVVTTACLMAMFAFPQLPEGAINGMILLCAAMMLVSLALYAKHFHAHSEAAEAEKRTLL